MRIIDIDTWERKRHYQLFRDYLNPYFTICADLDITTLLADCRARHAPFFATFLFYVMKVLNGISEFRTRIRQGAVVLHDVIHPSYTVMTEEKLFRFVTTPYVPDREEFIRRVTDDIDSSKKTVALDDDPNIDDLVYISSLKWVSFTMVTHPYDNKRPDSFPRITWGKYREVGNRWLIPVSVMAHHSLCDGDHAGMFYTVLQDEINRMA